MARRGVPWFLIRQAPNYKSVAGRAVISAAFMAVVLLLTGFQNWIDYYQFSFRHLLDGSFGINYNFSLPAYAVNLVYATYHFHPPQEIIRFWPQIGAASGLIVLAICYVCCIWRLKDPEIQFSFLVTAMLLCGARTLGHYFVLLIFPMATAFARTARTSPNRWVTLLILIFIALNLHDFRRVSFLFINHYVVILVSYIPLYGLIGLLIYLYKLDANSSSPSFDR